MQFLSDPHNFFQVPSEPSFKFWSSIRQPIAMHIRLHTVCRIKQPPDSDVNHQTSLWSIPDNKITIFRLIKFMQYWFLGTISRYLFNTKIYFQLTKSTIHSKKCNDLQCLLNKSICAYCSDNLWQINYVDFEISVFTNSFQVNYA